MKAFTFRNLTVGALLVLAQLTATSAAFAQITLTRDLQLSPTAPVVGQSTTATFTAKNSGTTSATIPYFLVGARSPSNANVDFPASASITLAPGQSYTYQGATSFASQGTYVAWPAYYNGSAWIQLAPARTEFSVQQPSPAHLTVVSPLTLSPSPPTIGQPVTASFTVKNDGGSALTLQYLLVGGRTSANENVDFPAVGPITLQPGATYTYQNAQTMSAAGTYTVWPAAYLSDWIELGAHITFSVAQPSPGHLTVVTPLTLSPSSPAVGQPVTASFTVKNDGGSALTLQYVLVGGRTSTNQNVDFPAVGPVTLHPGATYTYQNARAMSAAGTHTVWPAAYLSDWVELAGHITFSVGGSVNQTCWPSDTLGQIQYGYMPPAQLVGGGTNTVMVPAGYIHQTAWAETGGNGASDIEGVYAYDHGGWKSMVWRWADTMRHASIQHLDGANGMSAYRMELTPNDHASPGTAGDHPRAEFFSVDPAEDRRQRQPPRENIFRDGDEYWATFAMCLPADFPNNHRWATLVQRKFQNNMPSTYPAWFTLNVHRTTVDVALPGTPLSGDYVPIANLAELKNRWVQFVLHEKVSSRSDGYFEIFMDGVRKAARSGATIPSGDINFNIHYGYYRANERDDREPSPPGIGVVYYSPFLIFRGSQPSTSAPALP